MVTNEAVKEYYNTRHKTTGDESWRPPEAFPIFLNYMGVQSPCRFLDVGCGTGYLLRHASEAGCDAYGVDLSSEAIKLAQANAPRATISESGGEDLPFPDDDMDYLSCLGALEHFVDMEKGLAEFSRVVKPGGTLCILVPNLNYLYWMWRKDKGTEQQDINERLMTLDQWTDVFKRAGFQVIDIHQDRWWFLHKYPLGASLNPLRIAKALWTKLKWSILPLRYTYQFVFILKNP